MNRYGIIQLSDLQFGVKHRFGNPSKIHEAISRDINYLAERFHFQPIYLILTGDITETAHAKEFIEAKNSILKLALSVSIDKDSILCVPGNHDISWKLAEIASEVGDSTLKYSNFNKFVETTCNIKSLVRQDFYQRFFDHRIGLEFLFLNSCEKEDHENHFGYVDKDKLLKSIHSRTLKGCEDYTKLVLCHHRIDSTVSDSSKILANYDEIEAILRENDYHVFFSGHIHENSFKEIHENNKKLIFSGAGSTGVDKTQREDGTQNQYTIHVLDSYNKIFESYWRSYNPRKKTKFGIGGWTDDNSFESNPSNSKLPNLREFESISLDSMEDISLIEKYCIKRNPFTFSNAEKISGRQLIDIFVSSEGRNKSALRLSGDAIIRGSRGSGKTMLLRYLEIFGNFDFDQNIRSKKVSESFPVMVNLSSIHSSEWKGNPKTILESAEKLIVESALRALHSKEKELNLPSFKQDLHRVKQKLDILANQEGTIIYKLGIAVKEHMSQYFSHLMLLIDEVAPVFPKEFFTIPENGFLRWMNSIRNSGPYFTRIAVYPNDISDILNEERFGSVVNLDYNVKDDDDYIAYRGYCIELANKYLSSVSIDRYSPIKITNIIEIGDDLVNDGLEQIIYASDGSSRRFTSLMDKCITSSRYIKGKLFDKEDILSIIKEFSNNLLSSYDLSEKELAHSIAKACRKQTTYRFRLPGLTTLVSPLHAKNEELNIVKLAEVGSGRRGTTYEFSYPYCVLMDIQTHYLKDTRKVCVSRDRQTGEWISQVTTISKDQIDFFRTDPRIEGIVFEVTDDLILIKSNENVEYISEMEKGELNEGDKVTFSNLNGVAIDVVKLSFSI